MSVLEKLKNELGLEYYGINDIATRYDVKFLMENVVAIMNYFKNTDLESKFNIDDYIDYLWLKKQVKLEGVIPDLVSEEYKERMKGYIGELKEHLEKYREELIIRFVKETYLTIFQLDLKKKYYYFYLQKYTIDLIYNRVKITDAIRYIEKKYWYILINDFDKYKRFYKENTCSFSKYIMNEEIAISKLHDSSHIFEFLEEHKNEAFIIPLKKTATAVCLEILKNVKMMDGENCLKTVALFEKGYKLAKLYKLEELKKFEESREWVMCETNKNLEKHGKKIVIDRGNHKEIVRRLKESDEDHFVKFLEFSHMSDKNNFVSKYDEIMESRRPIYDSVTHIGRESHEYFTNSRIWKIDWDLECYSSILHLCLEDEALSNEILNNYYSILERMRLEGIVDSPFLNEFEGALSLLKSLFNSETDIKIQNSLSYGVAMLLVAFMEKLLRKIYVYFDKEKSYIKKEKATLSALLRSESIKEYLGHHHVRVIEYRMLRINNEGIGRNLRNSLMHNQGFDFDKIDSKIPALILYSLMGILNAIGIKLSRYSS